MFHRARLRASNVESPGRVAVVLGRFSQVRSDASKQSKPVSSQLREEGRDSSHVGPIGRFSNLGRSFDNVNRWDRLAKRVTDHSCSPVKTRPRKEPSVIIRCDSRCERLGVLYQNPAYPVGFPL